MSQTESQTDLPSPPPAPAKERPAPQPTGKVEELPKYHVVLLDDEEHTYHYVVEMVAALFNYPPTRGLQIAREVDLSGRAIVLTTHKELAELKRELIRGYGSDPRLEVSHTSMAAVIEPV